MKKYALLLPIAFLSALSAARAQIPPEWKTFGQNNGRYWASMSEQTKTAYTVGFMDAVTLAAQEMGPKGASSAASIVRSIDEVNGMTYGEWRQSVDTFYLEPMNRAIPIPNALFWVALKASGKAEEQLKEYERTMRRLSQKGQ